MRFGENNVLCLKYINIYEFWRICGGEDVHIPGHIFCLLLKKTEKVKEHDLYLSQILHHFYLKFFPRINNKNFRKRGPHSIDLYKVSILLTPGIFLIQIVNTNNTNMYLIHFHSKNNIKMSFPKS